MKSDIAYLARKLARYFRILRPSALTVHIHDYAPGAVLAPMAMTMSFKTQGYQVAFEAWRMGLGDALAIMENRIANCQVYWLPTLDDSGRLPMCREDVAPPVARYLPASHAVVYASPIPSVDPTLLRHEAKHVATRIYSHAGPLFDGDEYATP